MPRIIECPRYSCEQKLVKHSLRSGNTFGATFWTDGRMDAPMLPQYPNFTRCPECGWFFWVHKAEEVGIYPPDLEAPDGEKEPAEKKLPEIKEPSFKQYLEALDTKLVKWPDTEKELRLKAWRKYNDKFRPKPKKGEDLKAIKSTPESRENANSVLMLLYERNIEDAIAKAELLRELGRFGPSLQMLDIIDEYGLDEGGRFDLNRNRIRELAKQESSELAIIETEAF